MHVIGKEKLEQLVLQLRLREADTACLRVAIGFYTEERTKVLDCRSRALHVHALYRACDDAGVAERIDLCIPPLFRGMWLNSQTGIACYDVRVTVLQGRIYGRMGLRPRNTVPVLPQAGSLLRSGRGTPIAERAMALSLSSAGQPALA